MHRMMIRRRSGPGAATLSLLRASHPTFLFLAPLAPCGADPAPAIKPKLVIALARAGTPLALGRWSPRPRVMPKASRMRNHEKQKALRVGVDGNRAVNDGGQEIFKRCFDKGREGDA
jgi:hypothetical protein